MGKWQNGPDMEIVTYNTAVDSAHPRPKNSHLQPWKFAVMTSKVLLFYFFKVIHGSDR